MYVFGHMGLTVGAAAAAGRGADLRLAAALALLPDLIDKPAFLAVPGLYSGNTKGFGHTFLAAFAVGAALLLLRRRREDGLLLAACYAGHMLLDLGWTSNHPAVLLWPLLGPMPAPARESYVPGVILYNLAGELLGLLALLWLAWRGGLFERGRLRAFFRTGRLNA